MDRTRQTPSLHKFSWEGDLESIKLFIEEGLQSVDITDENGETALHWACRGGHHEVAKFLLLSGSSIRLSKKGKSPLNVAVEFGFSSCVDILIKAGAPINLDENIYKHEPLLHTAAANGHPHIVSSLLAAGADPTVTYQGSTALEVATMSNHKECVEVLKQGVTALEVANMAKKDEHIEVLEPVEAPKNLDNNEKKDEYIEALKHVPNNIYSEDDAADLERFRSAMLGNSRVPLGPEERTELNGAIMRMVDCMGVSEPVSFYWSAPDLDIIGPTFLPDSAIVQRYLDRYLALPISLGRYTRDDLVELNRWVCIEEPALREFVD